MSDLSVRTVPEGTISAPLRAVQSEAKTNPDSEASSAASRKGKSADITNYVTSPKGIVDPESGVYVLQYRDGATGEVLNQYPSEKAVNAYKRGASTAGSAVASTAAAPTAPSVPTSQAGNAQSGGGVGTGGTGVASAVGGSVGVATSAPAVPSAQAAPAAPSGTPSTSTSLDV